MDPPTLHAVLEAPVPHVHEEPLQPQGEQAPDVGRQVAWRDRAGKAKCCTKRQNGKQKRKKKHFCDLSLKLVLSRVVDLSIRLSKAKFDEEADFEVRSAVAPQKPRQIHENRNFRSKILVEVFFGVEK